MYMKKITLVLALGVSSCLLAQNNTDLKNNVIDVYGLEYANNLQKNNIGAYQFLEKCSLFAIEVKEINNPKYESLTVLSEIPLRSKQKATISVQEFLKEYKSGEFNALRYDFTPKKTSQYFRLGNTNYFLIVQNKNYVSSKKL